MEHSDWLSFSRDFTVWTITMEMARFRFRFRETQVGRNTKGFFKSGIGFFFSSQQYNYSKRYLVLHVKGYRSKLTDGRRRLRTFTKRRSVRSLKQTMPYRWCTTAGGRTKGADERSSVFVHQHGGDDVT